MVRPKNLETTKGAGWSHTWVSSEIERGNQADLRKQTRPTSNVPRCLGTLVGTF